MGPSITCRMWGIAYQETGCMLSDNTGERDQCNPPQCARRRERRAHASTDSEDMHAHAPARTESKHNTCTHIRATTACLHKDAMMREVLLQLLREVCLPLLQPTAKPAVQQVPKEHKSGLAGTAVMQTVHRRPLQPGAPNSAQSAEVDHPSAEAIQPRPWWLSFHAGHCMLAPVERMPSEAFIGSILRR